jgi:hypothetical protein
MPITSDKLAGARQPLPPVTFTFVIDDEEVTETFRFHRRVLSAQLRRDKAKEYAAKEAAEKAKGEEAIASESEREAMVGLIVDLDIQCLDILGEDKKPLHLTQAFWEERDDLFLSAVVGSFMESREAPKAQTPTPTNSGSLRMAS